MSTQDSEKAYAEAMPLTRADEDLLDYFKGLERHSLDAFEQAGRQLISLITTLLGLFFGVLAFKDNPSYLSCPIVKTTAALAAVSFIAALFFALYVLVPRRFDVPTSDLSAMRGVLLMMFRRKRRALLGAQITFAIGTLLLLAVILLLIFRG